ncbi:MAG: hypothetical protein AABW85_00365 [archaeon]
MTTTIENLALVAVAVVLVVSIVQATQLSGLNEKTAQQNIIMASLVSGGNATGIAAQASAPAQNAATGQAAPAPSQQMVGGC